MKQLPVYGGYKLKIYHYEKEDYNNGIAYGCMYSIKHELRAAKAYETTTGPTRRTLSDFVTTPAI